MPVALLSLKHSQHTTDERSTVAAIAPGSPGGKKARRMRSAAAPRASASDGPPSRSRISITVSSSSRRRSAGPEERRWASASAILLRRGRAQQETFVARHAGAPAQCVTNSSVAPQQPEPLQELWLGSLVLLCSTDAAVEEVEEELVQQMALLGHLLLHALPGILRRLRDRTLALPLSRTHVHPRPSPLARSP